MANESLYSSLVSMGGQASPANVLKGSSKSLGSASFKEVLRETYAKIDTISKDLASENNIIVLDGQEVDKTSSSASFIISKKLTDFEQIITIMMDILTKFKDLDKSLGQSMSR
jgi:hypothetical protein